jgi:predicted site-specific integrase-resolvase
MQIDVITNGRNNPVLTISDVSGMLGVHQNTVRRWSDTGLLRCFRVSQRGDRRYKYEDITGFLDGLNSRNV